MDDYYSLLGVDTDATVDDIRGAYRERKDALDTSSETGKADAARLNKAWNVLSDPYQRGRYDEQRASAVEQGEELEVVSTNGTGAPRARAGAGGSRDERRQAMRDARNERLRASATITPPAGTKWPQPKQRVIAMVIDIGVLFVLFMLSAYAVAPAIAHSQKPEVVHTIDRLTNEVDANQKASDDANKALSDAKKGTDQAAIKSAQDKADAAKAALSKSKDDLTKEENKLAPIQITVIGGFFLVGLLYLVVPSAMNGRTLGKRIQHLRVLRDDGSPLGGLVAFRRYGLVVIVTFALFVVLRLGPLGAAVVLFGVTTWMRNGNMQGMHDRFAHTIVVADANN